MAHRSVVSPVGSSFRLLCLLIVLIGILPGHARAQWSEQDVNFSTPFIHVLSIDAVDQNACWALAGNPNTFGPNQEFSRTTDGGTTWTPGIIPGATGLTASCVSALSANLVWVAYGDPVNIALRSKIFKTTDGGATWTHQSTAYPDSGNGSFCDIVHFFDANNGVAVGDPHGGYYEIYTTTNGGTNWIRVPSASIPPPLSTEFGLIPGPSFCALGNTVWFGTNRARVFRSTNRGATWTAAATGLAIGVAINDVAFKDANNGLAAAMNFGIGQTFVSKTTDGGVTWSSLTPPATLSPLLLSAVPGSPAYVMTSLTTFGTGQGSAYTLNDGATWTMIDDVPHGAVDFISPTVGWSGGQTRISGQRLSSPGSKLRSAAIMRPPTAGSSFGTSDKLLLMRYLAQARGRTVFVDQTASNEDEANGSRGGGDGGMWKWASSVLAVNEAIPSSAAGRFPHTSYPNPFNPATTIEFSLPEAAQTSLKIYNSAGSEIATLIDRPLREGRHTVDWHAKGQASGVYFYRLQASGVVRSGAMVLAK